MLLVHLRLGALPAPRPDLNLATDILGAVEPGREGDAFLEMLPDNLNEQD